MSKYKVGDVLRNKDIGATTDVISVTPAGNYLLGWKGGSNETLRSEGYIDQYYDVVKPFFEVGKTYRFRNGQGSWTYEIASLHEFEQREAVSIVSNNGERRRLGFLDEEDFGQMEEVRDDG